MSDQRVRAYCFTYNNYTDDGIIKIQSIKCKYLIYGKEKAPTTGTPHLQGYVYFKDGKALKTLQKKYPGIHWSYAREDAATNQKYCSKEGDFWEIGTIPMSQEDKGKSGAEKIAERWALAKAGSFEELPPEQIKVYEYIYSRNLKPADRNDLDNEWVFGKSGCGKSSYVRREYPEFYTKPMSKWWDGYKGEDVVVLDDFDPKHAEFLSYYLKIWADHYVFNAEVKGGMLKIRPKKIIVTSQYDMETCFQDRETLDALKRRFKIFHLIKEEKDLKTTKQINNASKKVPTKAPDPSTVTIQEAWSKSIQDGEEICQSDDSSTD